VFLDEIGELDPQIQVKLLRVLQSRTFQRIGEAEPRVFAGKLLAATNRDLAAEMHAGRFRHDLYYRLCADLIGTPTLAEQLGQAEDRRAELSTLVHFIARRVVGEEAAADRLTEQTVEFVECELGAGYGWPGNFRELEQCVRNVLIRRSYRPAEVRGGSAAERLAAELAQGKLTAEELVTRYVRLVYGQTGSSMETARRVGLDRRTVKARVGGE
jgi:DNA-binding NtrC family response regulator